MRTFAASRHRPTATALLALALFLAGRAGADEPLRLDVDLSEAPRRIYHARLVVPAKPGPLTLYYPKWIPGTHAPTGPVSGLTGLKIQAGGKTVPWRRDEVDAYALQCHVPEGSEAVEVSLDLVMPSSSRFAPTPRLAAFNWPFVLVYPKGKPMGAIRFRASLRLPDGWKLGTALPIDKQEGTTTRFAPVSLETLVDSPVLCGANFREVPLGPDAAPRHYLILAADSDAALDLAPEAKAGCDRLVAEAYALFGSRPYGSYRFLLALSDRLRPSGLEHHESSDNHLGERALLEPPGRKLFGHLLAHEYVHAWNGKYRRPADMVTADFQAPQRTRLLWVYEGLTDYLALVLAARSGLWTPAEVRDYLALTGERMNNRRGRTWRPLDDVAAAAHASGPPGEWDSWRRTTGDYYAEGVLLWLEVDMRIRALTGGKRSLDDFCRRFFAARDGRPAVKPYTLADLVAGLNAVAPHDWKAHFARRVSAPSEEAPLEGLRLGGWRLAYGPKPTEMQKVYVGMVKGIDLNSSLGMGLRADGTVTDVIRGKPADRAGIGPGMKLLAVNGRRWSEARLLDALTAAKTSGVVELLLENGDFFKAHKLTYRDGPRYPRLERLSEGKPDVLGKLLEPRNKAAKVKP